MPYYSFNIKKGKYQVEMKSDDVYFARRQVDKLFESLLKIQGKLRVVLPPVNTEKTTEKIEKENIIKVQSSAVYLKQEKQVLNPEEPQKTVIKVEEVVRTVDEAVNKKLVEPEKIEIFIEEPKKTINIVDEKIPEDLFKNILAVKTAEIIKEEKEQPLIQEMSANKKPFSFKSMITEKFKDNHPDEVSSSQKIEFANVKDEEISKILEEKIKKSLPLAENKVLSIEDKTENEIKEQLDLDYELTEEENNKIQNEFGEFEISNITIQNFESLKELIQLKNPQSKMEYLLLIAYYLQTKENLFKYSLKQLNTKAMAVFGSLIDHSIIHNAVANDFIEVIPDYNGTSEVTEYRLTAKGENYFLS